jgi:hypothetical protein
MARKETVELRALTADVEQENLVVRLKVFNPAQRTIYAYGSARRILYDNASGRLDLYLHDQHVQEDSSIAHHLREPRFVPLEGNTETEIKISLPKVMRRFRSVAETGGSGPITELLPVSEAKEVRLEIAHNDTPFYYNPKVNNARQLKEWGRDIATADFKVKLSSDRKE